MDTMRGPFAQDPDADYDEDEVAGDILPVALGRDERRMQVHAYNLWASLLGTCDFPRISQLDLANLPDFAPSSVLIDFSGTDGTPHLAHIGTRLADQAGIATTARPLADVPSGTLLSRFTDHYAEIFANQAPIGFEADFETPSGTTMLYRGILLPFAEDGATISQILGVINWKEQLDARSSEGLMREMTGAMPAPTAPPSPTVGTLAHPATPPGARARRWGWEAQTWDTAGPAIWPLGADDFATPEFATPDFTTSPDIAPWPSAPAHRLNESLADRLRTARALAQAGRNAPPRDHGALYAAIGAAHDLSLAADAAPQEAAALMAAEHLVPRPGAPLLPFAKLVFGADHDKTRLTEYATALAHARRLGLGAGTLAAHLAATPGGLKAVVATQRLHRPAKPATALPAVLAQALATLAPCDWAELAQEGDVTLAVVRRHNGTVEPLGKINATPALVERLLRQFLGEQGQQGAAD